jgi:ubiquinone/menaquinone biosynthesis C-methylase UbiE
MSHATARKPKAYKGIGLEGPLATWYAKNTLGSLPAFRTRAREIADQLDPGDWVLEVAPGPGYLAIELARLGLTVSTLDISRAFVRIAAENAVRAGVKLDIRLGDAAHMPFADESFDFAVCCAAFKNFSDPVGALKQMRRVLRPGGRALLVDMRREASDGEIAAEVTKMKLGGVDALFTRGALRSLRRRAYTAADFTRMIGEAGYSASRIDPGPIGFEIRLTK